jgi:hypothetical protein
MATLSIDVPAAVTTRVADAYIGTYPPPQGTDVSTAAAKLAYVKSVLIAQVREVVRSWEVRQAAITASDAASAKAQAEVVPT